VARPKFVQIPPHRLDRFAPLLGDGYAEIEDAARRARRLFAGRAIWHVSSTLRGGGVAEMLRALLPYVRGIGIDTRWVVLREQAEFFTLTKRLHNNLHGYPGDGGELGEGERRLYERTLAASAAHLLPLLQAGDIVFLHDPQTAGLAPSAKAAGARVVWRSHIGADEPNEIVRRAWDFLAPYVRAADAYVFSRREYVWDVLDEALAWTMAPSVDPFSPKNQELEPATVEAILGTIGLAPKKPALAPVFHRDGGAPARVERAAEILQGAPLPEGAPAVVQVSRWDRLKDHRGLLDCFDRHLSGDDLHLVLAGPAMEAVADDPEGVAVWEEIVAAWKVLAEPVRGRVHLVSLPMGDLDENGAMVNALQRRADVVVQKSLAEGFGLTVAEAMWKRRPVVASRVGGIQDQIVDGVSGVLVDDPTDLVSFAGAIDALLGDRQRAARIGEEARRRVLERFLDAGRLVEYVELLASLIRADG
jgi:trehalose synthase